MKIENLAVLSGEKITVRNGVIKYSPSYKTLEDNNLINAENKTVADQRPLFADIRAGVNFSQGTLKFKFKAQKQETGIILISPGANPNLDTFIGLSYGYKSFIIFDGPSDTNIKAGTLQNFSPNQEIEVYIEFVGSKCKLFVNNILFCESNSFALKSFPIQFRIRSNGEVTVYDISITSIRPKLFVVMQFTEEYNKLYDEVINPISEKMGFECIRADDLYTSTPILKDIISSIEESTAIIAEITPDNPNVFYEIGYSHAIKKPTILLCDKRRDKLPFDVSGFRTLFYENTIAGKSKIEKSLSKYLENIR